MQRKIRYTKDTYINNIKCQTVYDFDSKEEAIQFFKDNNFEYPLSPKQWGLIKFLKGDVNRKFTSEAEFSAYVESLKTGKPVEQEIKDVPWDDKIDL